MDAKYSAELAPTFGKQPIDKIKKFHWNKILNKPGCFEEIDKAELYVSPEYQRSIWNQRKINEIAANWSWPTCGTLHVAIRNDQWWVFDGATRKFAADKRSDIKKLPCMVYELNAEIANEALEFVKINNSKSAVKSHDRFRSLIVGGDKDAIGLRDLLKSTGHKAGIRGGIKTVACLMTVWRLYLKNKEVMNKIWPLIADVNEECMIRDQVVAAIFYAEIAAMKQNMTLTENPFRSFLIKRGGSAINNEIKKEVVVIGRGGPRIHANSLIKLINKAKIKGKEKIKLME